MRYLIWINELVVIENNEEYDFLDEMYPEIKDKYNIMWAIKKLIAILSIFWGKFKIYFQ